MSRKSLIEHMTAEKKTAMYQALARGSTRRAVFAQFGLTLRTAQNYLKRGRDYRSAFESGDDARPEDRVFYEFLEKVEQAEGEAESSLAQEQYQVGVGEMRAKIKIHWPLGKLTRIAELLGLGPRPPISEPELLLDWLENIAAHEDAPADMYVDIEAWRQRDTRAGQFMLTRRFGASGWTTKSLVDESDQNEADLAFL